MDPQYKIFEKRHNNKASEVYVKAEFRYGNSILEFDIPVEYRRTGLDLLEKEEIEDYIAKVWDELNPKNWVRWKSEQAKFWASKQTDVTRSFFDVLSEDFKPKSVNRDLPRNPNPARRIQDIKDFGYTVVTIPYGRESFYQLLPLKRGGVNGYETWSKETRDKIIAELKGFDAYEAKKVSKASLLPDHKFPEVRWDVETRRESLENLTRDQLRSDFQLINNQRNQQKREVCRSCYQTGKRGIIYGIPFFYCGNAKWPSGIPRRGKAAEEGCVGCGWYDIERWRKELIKTLSE